MKERVIHEEHYSADLIRRMGKLIVGLRDDNDVLRERIAELERLLELVAKNG